MLNLIADWTGPILISLLICAVVLIAIGWWVTGDPWYVFVAIYHSHHYDRSHP